LFTPPARALRGDLHLGRAHVDAGDDARADAGCNAQSHAARAAARIEHLHAGLQMRDEEGAVRIQRAARDEIDGETVVAEGVAFVDGHGTQPR
jgi:hypothetical protein